MRRMKPGQDRDRTIERASGIGLLAKSATFCMRIMDSGTILGRLIEQFSAS